MKRLYCKTCKKEIGASNNQPDNGLQGFIDAHQEKFPKHMNYEEKDFPDV